MHAVSPKGRKPRGRAIIRRRIGAPPEAGKRQLGDEFLFDRWVGQRIRARRFAMGISQSKLAEELGLTFQQVQKYERGTNRVGASRLYRLTHILRVPPGYFFEGLAQSLTDAEAEPIDRTAYTAARLLARLSPKKRRAAIGLLNAMAEKGGGAHG